MKTIKIANSNTIITVATAEEMSVIFSRLYPWVDLIIDGDFYHYDYKKPMFYTDSYLAAKYF